MSKQIIVKVHVPSVQVGGWVVIVEEEETAPGLTTAAVPPGVIITSGLRSGWAKKYQKYQSLYVLHPRKKISQILEIG